MPSFISTASTTTSLTTEDFYVLTGNKGVSADGIVFTTGSDGSDLLINGSLFTSTTAGEGVVVGVPDVSITVSETGQVFSQGRAFDLNADAVSLQNFGHIESFDNTGVDLSFVSEGGSAVQNHGVISGKTNGILLGSEDSLVTNSGLITGATAVFVDDDNNTLINTGTIAEKLPIAAGGGS